MKRLLVVGVRYRLRHGVTWGNDPWGRLAGSPEQNVTVSVSILCAACNASCSAPMLLCSSAERYTVNTSGLSCVNGRVSLAGRTMALLLER